MFIKRTDLALEARELWQESAERTTRLMGVKATKSKLEGYPVTRVDILDHRGEEALGNPRAAISPLTSPPSGSGRRTFSSGRSGPWARS